MKIFAVINPFHDSKYCLILQKINFDVWIASMIHVKNTQMFFCIYQIMPYGDDLMKLCHGFLLLCGLCFCFL